MDKTVGKTNKQKIVTVVTVEYVELLVPDLLMKSFDAYIKRDFSKRTFQASVFENTHATAGIILVLLALEAYRNRIYYLEKKPIHKGGLAHDISTLFKSKDNSFAESLFTDLITELVIVRDVIVHNHLYEVEIINDGNWDMISHRQKLLKDYGDGKRLRSGLVIEQSRKTKSLKLNVQTAKIGFEDLFTVLVIFDLFIGIANKLLTVSHVPFHFNYKFNGSWIDHLSHFLSYYYVNNPNKARKKSLSKIYKSMQTSFAPYIPNDADYFLDSMCPKCHDYGFHQPFHVYKCSNCGFEIKLNH